MNNKPSLNRLAKNTLSNHRVFIQIKQALILMVSAIGDMGRPNDQWTHFFPHARCCTETMNMLCDFTQ
ncbi:hypothetical protein [Methyloprofundus sedimenti]|uniref:hypothetical protein n=1 Tax=Methyloprofundus sedimenti TaxID=1420851 RepID=UPI0011806FF1|nr:hypothetical protein [Methyloprofundus sedimenti]